eukprot:augustus_masked-scaffold_62-processed-gene-0.16-mRNA-1 protein AED:1.00 eAED:1.00 QI:0/-1/0/0/-1/1/1/0/2107
MTESPDGSRKLNMNGIMRMFAEMMKEHREEFGRILERQKEDHKREMQSVINSMGGRHADIHVLEEFTLKSMERFIYEYERELPEQREYISLRSKLGKIPYKQFECLGQLGSNEDIIEALKKKVVKIRVESAGSAGGLIKDQLKFKQNMDEEEAVEILFQEVEEILSYLPPHAERKGKSIAKAIFSLLPPHIWVRKEDLSLKPELKDDDRTALKEYVLASIPPKHIRKELKVYFSGQSKGKPNVESKVTNKKMPAVSKKVKYAVKVAKPAVKQEGVQRDAQLLCDHDWQYGHTKPYCYDAKAGNPAKPYPGKEEMERRLKMYLQRKSQTGVIAAKNISNAESVMEEKARKYFGASNFTVLDEVPEGLFNESKNESEGKEDSVNVKVMKVVDFMKVGDKNKYGKKPANAYLPMKINGTVFNGLLDSGAYRSAINGKFKSCCNELRDLKKPIRVQAAGGVVYPVHQMALIDAIEVLDESRSRTTFVFEKVEAMVMEVPEWDDIIIGNEVLNHYELDPVSAMKMKFSKDIPPPEKRNLAGWFVDTVGVEDPEAEEVNVKSMLPWNESQLPPEIFGESWPEESEYMDIENIDLGAGADVEDVVADDLRLKERIRVKVESVGLQEFGDSLTWKHKFLNLFLENSKAFGDGESYTQLSKITPIKCDVMEGAVITKQKQLPLGQEQQDFLHSRVEKMVKAGIIEVNDNPVIAMSTLVVPKKGPKKFRLVVDFRPLNKVTLKVDNTLPLIDLQLDRIRGNSYFCGFDLLSGFDYLACDKQAGKYFTFTTPWGVAYSFLGAPQGWCNTPSLFSMRQISEVLQPAGLWPKYSLQWIDDSIIMGGSLSDLYDNTEKFMKQIRRKQLRLNIDKCDLVNRELVFCGRKFNAKGWTYDGIYAEKLLSRVKPVYLHELAQLVYTANFISSVIPGFSRIRKLLLGSNKISGKLKNLERKRIMINWDVEMNLAYDEMISAIENSMHHSLGYYNPKENIYLFTDASDRFYSLYITQTKEEVDLVSPFKSNYRVIALSSGSFTGSSLKWHISCKELYPVLMAVKKFPYYLKYNVNDKVLFTDHKNLVNILNPSNVKLKSHGNRLSRWALEFMELNLIACHLDGYQNIPADCLSRWLNPKYRDQGVKLETICRAIQRIEDRSTELDFWRSIDLLHVSPRHPGAWNVQETGWQNIDDKLLFDLQKKDFEEDIEELQRKDEKIIVTKSLIPLVMLHAHLLYNHGSRIRELSFVKKNYYFEKEVLALYLEAHEVFRRQCMHCQKPSLVVRRPLHVTEWGNRAGQVLLSDYLYINTKGWVLTLVDSLTRTTILRYCEKATAENLVAILWDWHGHFQLRNNFILVTDRGSHFTAKVVEQFLRSCGCSHKFTATYVSHTAGAVEVQNRNILRHLRSLVSEFGLSSNDWPDILMMVQAHINQTPLSCRGSKLTPLQLMIGVDEDKCPLGSIYKNMDVNERRSLEEVALKLRDDLEKMQKDADVKGFEYRAKNNLRRSKGAVPICFNEGEYVWLSEKEVSAGKKDKTKPRWCGPYQVKSVVSDHLYLVADLDGKEKLRHSTLLIPFAPVSFLPSPLTKLVFRMDKNNLEVERFTKLVKGEENNLFFEVKWKGFSDGDNTLEPVTTMYEDLPDLVKKFIENNSGKLVRELVQYLSVIFENFEMEVDGNISSLYAVSKDESTSFDRKLLYGKVVIDENGVWSRSNWSTFETESLRFAILVVGFGDFQSIRKFVPGKTKQQLYTKIQRLVGRQSLKVYHGLKLDVRKLKQDNLRYTGCNYYIQSSPLAENKMLLKKILFRWKYLRDHKKNEGKYKEKKLVVFNITYSEGVETMLKTVREKDSDLKNFFPKFNGSKDDFLCFLKNLWSDLKAREVIIGKRIQEVDTLLFKWEVIPQSFEGMRFIECETPNLIKVVDDELNCVFLRWKPSLSFNYFSGDVRTYLAEAEEKFDIIVADPPWSVFSGDPIRGPSVTYTTMKDDEIANLNLRVVMENTLVFIWVVRGKEKVVEKLFERNSIQYKGKILWIKTNGKDKILSTLGNLTMKCTEECYLGVYNNLPGCLKVRSLGKEILYGRRNGNSQKPIELYNLIEQSCTDKGRFLELFGRKNNLREKWFTVGNEL